VFSFQKGPSMLLSAMLQSIHGNVKRRFSDEWRRGFGDERAEENFTQAEVSGKRRTSKRATLTYIRKGF